VARHARCPDASGRREPKACVPGIISGGGARRASPLYQRWRRTEGKLPLARFTATTDPQVAGRFGNSAASGVVPDCECQISLAALAPQLRLEVQYALQCRRDKRLARTPVTTVAPHGSPAGGPAGHLPAGLGPGDLPDVVRPPGPGDTGPRALVIYGRRELEDLTEDHGWETEYRRDV
jgi:hypothetical protein